MGQEKLCAKKRRRRQGKAKQVERRNRKNGKRMYRVKKAKKRVRLCDKGRAWWVKRWLKNVNWDSEILSAGNKGESK